MELDDRKLKILKAVIQNYLETGWLKNHFKIYRFKIKFGNNTK